MLDLWRELDEEILRTGAVSEALYDRAWEAIEAHAPQEWTAELAALASFDDRTLATVVSIAARVVRGHATALALATWSLLVARIPGAAPYSDVPWRTLDPFVEQALVVATLAPFEWAAADDFAGAAAALAGRDAVAAAIAMWALSDRPTRALPERLLRDARRWRESAVAPACFVATRLV